MLHIINVALKLLIKNAAVGNYNDAMKDYLVTCVVEVCQVVRKPSDRVRFARPRRMLNQVVLARTIGVNIRYQLADGIQLVIAWEYQLLFSFVVFGNLNEAVKNIQNTILLQDFLPK